MILFQIIININPSPMNYVFIEIPSFDVKLKIDLYPSPQIFVINLENSNKISSATLCSFNNNADVSSVNLTINNNQIAFNATDKISIIQLSKYLFI
jgi:hypothetical protein